MEKDSRESIAIVGMGCRFPGGASNPQLFWQLLCEARDAIVDVPNDRWDIRRFYDPDPDKPGKAYVKQGGFLREKIDHFDPLFFGISPREAESMDPQQRLLLEVTLEAFEDAGLDINALAGSRTGVFIGGFCLDNLITKIGHLDRELTDTHTAASSSMTILANRISYIFNLQGPSVTMDTACSSSLVTTHHACQSIWQGESDMAITGGVNVMLRPEFPIVMSKGHFLSEHGRCMTFDARAGGYSRGEGAGIVILKPLSLALQNKDRIYALIKMTGVNQDGHTQGISMPNSVAQENLIREVYKKARIAPAGIHYIEAHGTGTQAGDPKELQALNNVLSVERNAEDKCVVGSVKTNIGHLEAAAGIAGLMKATLALYKQEIPPNLHFEQPNPQIPFDKMCLRVPVTVEQWPANNNVRYAGVNSFGYGGTNAHTLLQEAEQVETEKEITNEIQIDKPFLLPVSARSNNALKELAGRYAFYLTTHTDNNSLTDFLYTASSRRTHHNHRIALVAHSAEELREQLQSCSSGDYVEHMSSGTCDIQNKPQLVFIYTGMGPQWWGMGRELMKHEPTFINSIRQCDEQFSKEAGWSILEALQADEETSQIAKTEVAQPANFVIQVALTELWKDRGIVPDAVIGHSVGEVASAYISGALSLTDAIKVSVHRSRLQGTLAGQGGGMLAVNLAEQAALEIIKDFNHVSIAAINSPNTMTLSGNMEQLQKISENLQAKEIFNRFLQVEVAYHSSQMDDIQSALHQSLSSLNPQRTKIPLYSTVTGELIDGSNLGADYWWQNVREPVRFSQGITSILIKGFDIFLEIGPHPVLAHSVKEIATSVQKKANLVPSLHNKFPEQERMLESLGQLYTLGFSPAWHAITPQGGQLVSLPNYPWQRERYWRESHESIQDRLGLPGHVFLNRKLPVATPTWSVEINEQYFPFLRDHQVNNEIVFPGAAYVEAGLAAHSVCVDSEVKMLADLEFHNILFIEPKRVQELGISYDENTQCFKVHSRFKEEQAEWKLHASGRLITEYLAHDQPQVNLEELREQFTTEYPIKDLYKMLSSRGLDYGHHFQNARHLRVKDDEILVQIESNYEFEESDNNYFLHPALFDTAIHSILSVIPGNYPFVPVSINKINFYSSPGNSFWCHAIVTKRAKNSIEADITLIDNNGKICAKINQSVYNSIETLADKESNLLDKFCYEISWEKYSAREKYDNKKPVHCLVFANNSGLQHKIEEELTRAGITYTSIYQAGTFRELNKNCFEINKNKQSDFELLLNQTGESGFTHIIYLWSHSSTPVDPDINNISGYCMPLFYLVKALGKTIKNELDLILLTSGSNLVVPNENNHDLNASPISNLGLLIENEFPDIHCRTIDLDQDTDITQYNNWFDVLLYDPALDIAFRSGDLFVKKIKHLNIDLTKQETTEVISTENPVSLELTKPSKLDSLVYHKNKRVEPGPDEIEIKIHYSSLNYKDLLKVYNLLPDKIITGTRLGKAIGMESAGTIVGVGSNVKALEIGDEVIAPIAGSFRSYATIPARFVIKKPVSLKMEESLIHVNYVTAYYAVVEKARLKAGEKILIHSASGGLGLAAIQVAQWCGAEIFATAGTEEKREYLRSLGIALVMDSHNLDFIDQVKQVTTGTGVDVVLNSLSGEALIQSFNLLAPYGRFIEVGKTDIVENNGLPMAVFNRNISFTSIDIDRLHAERPEIVDDMVKKVEKCFKDNHFSAIPTTVFSASNITDAFRYMAQGKHIGKIVVKFENENVDAVPDQDNRSIYNSEGTYLITGGTKGFGLELAKWLGKKNIGNLVLISRSGSATEEARQTIEEIQASGCNVSAYAIDVLDLNALQELVTNIENRGSHLRGVIHAATTYNDAFIKDIDEQIFSNVVNPKVQGALNLYNCTKSSKLDFFVMFSSISSLVGNRGQCNYIAANSFLDEFARLARINGCPAVTINWGALAESGIVARNQEINDLLQQQGIKGLGNHDALQLFDQILTTGKHQVGAFNVDWAQWARLNQVAAQSNRFKDLVTIATQSDENQLDAKARQIIEQLTPMSIEEQQQYIESLLCKGLAQILKLAPDKIDVKQDLNGLGIDSLMLLELSLLIQDEFSVEISTMSLLKVPTISTLAEKIKESLLSVSICSEELPESDQNISTSTLAS